jgi:hypothetical protein
MHIFRRILKWALWLTGLLLLVLMVIATGVFFTPKIVSTDWFRHQFELRASSALHRAIAVQDLQVDLERGDPR